MGGSPLSASLVRSSERDSERAPGGEAVGQRGGGYTKGGQGLQSNANPRLKHDATLPAVRSKYGIFLPKIKFQLYNILE